MDLGFSVKIYYPFFIPFTNNSNAVIVVSGGMFYQFDPSNNTVGEGEVVVAEGYTVVRCDEDGTANDAGDWYKVVAE